MTTNKTQSLSRQRAAVKRIKAAGWTYHDQVRRLERDSTLYPEERAARLAEARDKAEAEVAAAKEAFAAGMAADRAERARWADAPTGQELNQRLYYQQAAAADLAGLSGDAAVALIDNLVAQGATVQAREYLRAARPSISPLDYGRLDRATLPEQGRAARAWGVALDAFEMGCGLLDDHIAQMLHTAAHVSEAERRGDVVPSESFDTRGLDLMLDGAEQQAVQAMTDHVRGEGSDGVGLSGGEQA